MRAPTSVSFLAALSLGASAARAEEDPEPVRPALEINVLQPFLGITDDKILLPVARRAQRTFRGELMLGTYTDFAWGPVSRPASSYGKVWIIGVRPGYREYLAYGFFVDASIVVGWRHEEQDIHDGGTLNGFYGRLWANAGWQVDLPRRTFVNLRGGAGVILFRTDRYGSTERLFQPAADIDFGVRF
jgi:hypothetical protein